MFHGQSKIRYKGRKREGGMEREERKEGGGGRESGQSTFVAPTDLSHLCFLTKPSGGRGVKHFFQVTGTC